MAKAAKGKVEPITVKVMEIGEVVKLLQKINDHLKHTNNKLEHIMAKQQDAAAKLNELGTQLAKANTEIQAKIQELQDAATNADVTPELQAAIDNLVPAAQALDDIVPDTAEGGGETEA